jgi:predicted O-linked N-acetylglucosamine transferase (SPINDLY family)
MLLGALQLDRGAAAEAVASMRRAATIEPQSAPVLLQLAVAQFRSGDIASAKTTLRNLLVVHPQDAPGAFHLGLLCEREGDEAAAEHHYRAALQSRPGYREALVHFGLLLQRQARHGEALPVLERAWNPSAPQGELAIALARVHLDTGRFDSAIEYARIATHVAPQMLTGWLALGIALRESDQLLAAREALLRARELAPDNALVLAETGCNEIALGYYEEGCGMLRRARELAPDWHVVRWLDALALPVLPASVDEARRGHRRFRDGIEALLADLGAGVAGLRESASQSLRRAVPFHLHYLPFDTTSTTFRYADLIEQATSYTADDSLRRPLEWRALAHGGRVRVGFVSSELRLHTVTRYFSGWFDALDRERFELQAWHLGVVSDEMTARIAARIDGLHHVPDLPVSDLAATIRAAQLDVLVYLDVGMDSRPQMLAALRLAPVQCVAYGHPATTGLRKIDWFLSGDAMEPWDATAHYRERLERLPGLGVVPTRPPEPGDGSWLPRDADRPLLLCLQSLFKLSPELDDAFARIAEATDAKIVFFEFPVACSTPFLERLGTAFQARGLDLHRHVVVLGRRDYASYLGGIANADLVLDSTGFSGGATSLDALSVGTPIVTVQGEFMRGRQTAAMLRMLGAEFLIANNVDSYVDIAIDLCRDRSRREDLRKHLKQRSSILFEQADVFPALQAFFLRVARDSAAAA